MTAIYDPTDSAYTDEAEVRTEMARVFDVCGECRRCVDVCATFPTLFEMLDVNGGTNADRMTPAAQDRVVDTCTHCTLCSADCPFTPDRHESNVDVPRLMLRAQAMRRSNRHMDGRSRVMALLLGRAQRIGRLATRFSTAANRVGQAEPGSRIRSVAAVTTGLTATRRLPVFARRRFSAWFASRPRITLRKKQASVSVFPTCIVDHVAVDVGKDLVKVYERNGVQCASSVAGCCGAPSLHAGDIDRFAKIAAKNVTMLTREIGRGNDIVVAQPSCLHVIRHSYAEHLADPSVAANATAVAARTYDASEYLMTLHAGDDYVLDTHFDGSVPRRITYHVPSHLRSEKTGFKSRDLLKLTGATVKLVQSDAGISSLWGYRSGADDVAGEAADDLAATVESLSGNLVAGDCHLANTAIAERTGFETQHPLQIIARAYGIVEES